MWPEDIHQAVAQKNGAYAAAVEGLESLECGWEGENLLFFSFNPHMKKSCIVWARGQSMEEYSFSYLKILHGEYLTTRTGLSGSVAIPGIAWGGCRMHEFMAFFLCIT